VLRTLIQEDLSFKGAKANRASHNLHAFAAKFPPQIPGVFIETLTSPNEIVLDPMSGSGTTLVEASARGRVGIGFDLDPLAVKIARMKTQPLDASAVWGASRKVIRQAEKIAASPRIAKRLLKALYPPEALEFFRYWFQPETMYELASLSHAVRRYKDHGLRNFLEVVFSSIIITKSGGVSLARDLAHSRPHRVFDKEPKGAIEVFSERVVKALHAIEEIELFPGSVSVARSDSPRLPLANESVHLIVTSPPYANAIDYVRAHKFSLIWLGYRPSDLASLRRTYIGAEVDADVPDVSSPTAREAIDAVCAKDPHKGRVLKKYFVDMAATISEMYRVLKRGRACIIVVGTSTIRGIEVNTASALSELGITAGFRLAGMKARQIDRDRRLMPMSRASDGQGIEARMHEEHVIALHKA
ncbi:MAG: DNA methyltransferase, partial [Bacteroidota bacterium]